MTDPTTELRLGCPTCGAVDLLTADDCDVTKSGIPKLMWFCSQGHYAEKPLTHPAARALVTAAVHPWGKPRLKPHRTVLERLARVLARNGF